MCAKVLAKRSFKLTDCLDRIVDNRGKTPPLSETGIELIEVGAIIDGRKAPAFENVRKFVLEETYAKWFRSGHPRRGDTLISTVGAIGRVAYVQDERGCIAQNIVSLRPKTDVLDGEFLYYFLSSSEVQHRLLSLNIGVAQPSLKVPHLLSLEIELPPISAQQRIAGVLSAYDELIENSQRRIKTLESMARALYREWFVYFRYPGHESVPLVPSALGDIPQGWEVKKLGQIADINWGDTSVTKAAYVDSGYPAYSASGPDGKLDHYDFDRLGVVLSAIGAQCGKMWLARGKWSCIKNTIKFWSNDECVSTEFLFLSAESEGFWPKRGAAQPFISQGDAKSIDILIPDLSIMRHFTAFVATSLESIATLHTQVQNLRDTRDLLLPRLLSGQINVDSDAA